MAHVLIVTLGPIQDFIAAARRSRDLWFGSWLLSELSKATAQAMAEDCGLDALVFPGVLKPDELWPGSPTSVANKIVVRVPDGKDPKDVADRGKDGMRERLEWLRDDAFKNLTGRAYFEGDNAEKQIQDLIEFAWVSAPEVSGDYQNARREAEALLTARKHTRLWGPVRWGGSFPKSSIDGERESVLHEDLFDSKKNGELTPRDVRKRYGVGPTERLCAVGLLKRHGRRPGSRYEHRFLSTGHLAAWPLYNRTKDLEDPELQAAWDDYLAVLRKGGVDLEEQKVFQSKEHEHSIFGLYDGSLLFENRLPELFEEVVDPEQRKAGLRDAKAALAKVLKKIGVSTPLPYYAILLADGDHMGKAIENQETFQAHQQLSRKLDEFAQEVKKIVEKDYQGELIYSGGDDVLAFVPLHNVIACAQALAADFSQRLADFKLKGSDKSPTLSAGIGISHFMDPMRGALNLARKAESKAKEERESLAVIVDKRSGPPTVVFGKWGTLDLKLQDYVNLHRKDEVPDGAAYELRELARLTEGVKSPEKEKLSELVQKEAKRILRRKQPQHGQKDEMKSEVLTNLEADVEALPVQGVADRLIVARLLAQADEEANPSSPGAPK